MQEACESFEYGGCAGNTNNFLSLKQCNDQCFALKSTKLEKAEGERSKKEFRNYETGMWKEVEEEGQSELSKAASACSLPPDSGPCKANYTRWNQTNCKVYNAS